MDSTLRLNDLVRRCQQREVAAFDTLADMYSLRLYGFMYKFTGSREDAQDLTQEVFVRVVRTIADYQHSDRFESWLFRIAANLARDRLRKLRSAPALETWNEENEQHGSRECVRKGSGESGDSEQAEAAGRVHACLAKLPDAEREVVLLRFYSDLGFAEIAELMGTPLGTALARAHRGLSKMRGWMESESS